MQNAMYWKTAHIENTTLACFKLGNGMHGAYEEFSQAIERVVSYNFCKWRCQWVNSVEAISGNIGKT